MSFFAPVPGEYAASYQVGANYSGHVVGSGPYTRTTYIPGKTVVLDRNPNWDPATDPLRTAWVDRIQVRLNVAISSIQQQIEREEADLSLDSHVPQTQLAALKADPQRSRWLSVNPTGTLLFLVLGAAGTLHPATFGRCPHPAGLPPGPTDASVKVVPPRRGPAGRGAAAWGRPAHVMIRCVRAGGRRDDPVILRDEAAMA